MQIPADVGNLNQPRGAEFFQQGGGVEPKLTHAAGSGGAHSAGTYGAFQAQLLTLEFGRRRASGGGCLETAQHAAERCEAGLQLLVVYWPYRRGRQSCRQRSVQKSSIRGR